MRKIIAAAFLSLSILGFSATVINAEQPGPGDKQCIPGQQGNPHPAHKAGVC